MFAEPIMIPEVVCSCAQTGWQGSVGELPGGVFRYSNRGCRRTQLHEPLLGSCSQPSGERKEDEVQSCRRGTSWYFHPFSLLHGRCSAPEVPRLPDPPGKQAGHEMAETLFCHNDLGQATKAVCSLSCRRPALARHAAKNLGPWLARWGGHLCPPALTLTLISLSLSRSYLSPFSSLCFEFFPFSLSLLSLSLSLSLYYLLLS